MPHKNVYQEPRISEGSSRQIYVNAIELDLSLSKDNVIFLWHDPNPGELVARIRR